MFRFKQFTVDQSNCAMKINTDGVLLAALLQANEPARIIDIGTGTGVIALMLAQRFKNASVTGVEIDEKAVVTAGNNFNNSPFFDRLEVENNSFQNYFRENFDQRVDLIVSNPPFFINSLKSASRDKEIARHTDESFFNALLGVTNKYLSESGRLWLILPMATSELVLKIADDYNLYVQQLIKVHSFENQSEHRHILSFGKNQSATESSDFIIYSELQKYSTQYKSALKDFFINF